MDNKFSSNLIVFIIGLLIFATDLFSQMPTIDRTGISLIGGYTFLSIYHGWKFAAPRVSDLSSAVVFWILPIIFGFTILSALLVGMVISIPKFVSSFFMWRSSRNHTRDKTINAEATTTRTHEPRVKNTNSSNVVRLNRNK